jgi:hypothetical protein
MCSSIVEIAMSFWGEGKVVRNKDPRKKEYWQESSEDTLNPIFPLGILGFKVRESNLLSTCFNNWSMPLVCKIIFSHLLSYLNVYCRPLMCLLRQKFKCQNHKSVDKRLSCVVAQFKSQPLGRMLHKNYQLDASEGSLLIFWLKIKTHKGGAHHCRAFLPITKSCANPKVIHTHTHTHTHTKLL